LRQQRYSAPPPVIYRFHRPIIGSLLPKNSGGPNFHA
jgi:hypothetical protein